jgi:signal transduction histidine kinase
MRHQMKRTTLIACGTCCAALALVVAAARSMRRLERRSFPQTPTRVPSRLTPSSRVTGSVPTKPDPARNRAAVRDGADALSRRKQDFLGLLSHELRNPLNAIRVALGVMRAGEDVDAGRRALAVIERQVTHIARLVEDLVDTARIERGTLSLQVEPVDVRDVLSTALDMAEPSVNHRRQELIWDCPPEPMLVNGDRVRLQQVFSNLLLNASKYTPEYGQIELRMYRAASDFCVAVRDNGKGIAAEDLRRVFEPFVRATRDEPGLGVGLYVARTLVEQHGGEISVDSNGSDRGATFTVRLPELSPLLIELLGGSVAR